MRVKYGVVLTPFQYEFFDAIEKRANLGISIESLVTIFYGGRQNARARNSVTTTRVQINNLFAHTDISIENINPRKHGAIYVIKGIAQETLVETVIPPPGSAAPKNGRPADRLRRGATGLRSRARGKE